MKKFRILVVDDDVDLVKTLRMRLEFEGFETFAAHEGVRGVEMTLKKKPHLILLDLRMPAGSGQTVLKTLRANPDTEKIPVIIITALDDPRLETETKEAGASAFFRKPYSIETLLEKIRFYLPPMP